MAAAKTDALGWPLPSLRDIGLLAGAAIGANYTLDKLIPALARGDSLLETLQIAAGSANVFQLFAWCAVFRLLTLHCDSKSVSQKDFAGALALACGFVAANALGQRLAFDVLATFAAFWFCLKARSNGDAFLTAAAAVLLALAANAIWGPVAFSLCADVFLAADDILARALMSAFAPQVTQLDIAIAAPDGNRIVLLDQCSSFHNMTLALLCWVSVTMWRRNYWLRADVLTAIAACAAMFAMNAARIFAMSLGRESYIYWHDGAGAALFGMAVTTTIAATCVAGAYLAERGK